MSYIDKVYYEEEFLGTSSKDDTKMVRIFKKASDEVDILIGFKIDKPIDEYPDFVQNGVKKATALIAEHFVINGGYDAVKSDNLQSANLGSFSYSKNNNKVSNIPQDVFSYLSRTGLLHSGVNSGCSYNQFPNIY